MNGYPQTKAFIRTEAKAFHALQVKNTHGDPQITFYDGEQELQIVDVSRLSKDKIVALLVGCGMHTTS